MWTFRRKILERDEVYDFALIARYTPKHDRLTADLDIDEVFRNIDQTTSKIGQQYLYKTICSGRTIGELNEFDTLVDKLEKDSSLSTRCRGYLRKISSRNGYYFEQIFTTDYPKTNRIWLTYVLTATTVMCITISFFFTPILIALLPIFITNAARHYINKQNIRECLVAVSELSKSVAVAKSLSAETKIDTNFIKDVEKIKFKAKFIGFENQINNEAGAILWGIIELIKISFNIEIIVYHLFIDQITEKRKETEKLFCYIGEIDSAMSVATLRQSDIKLCKPVFTGKKEMELCEIYHPLIDNCVENSLKLEEKSLLLTGSNMSGKTTFIRTVAINSILAQSIFTCFAKVCKAPFHSVYSSIKIEDSLMDNKSYYLTEVLTIKEFITISSTTERSLFVMDEIFKGTNTVERIAAAEAILDYLNRGNNLILVSTHDTELTDKLSEKRYELYYFSEQIIDNKLIFDYKLHKGGLKTTNAIKILDLYGYPPEIVKNANNNIKI